MARINRDDVDKLYDYDIYIPSRTIYMGSVSVEDGDESGTDAVMAERVIKALHLLDQKDEPITIIMNNPGGDWYHGMAIFDAIQACKSHVTIKVMGMAMSMGGVILQAADERVMSPNSRFMMHYGTMGMDATHAKIFENWGEESKKINKAMEDLFLDKIREVNPSFTREDLEKLLHYDTILTPHETIELGLADTIA